MGGWNKRRLSCNGVNRVKSSDTITPHESEQTSTWSLITREPEKPTSGEKADDRYGHIYWCVLWRPSNLVHDQMEQGIQKCPSAAGTYCEGDTGKW